jgi:hypothetical protein
MVLVEQDRAGLHLHWAPGLTWTAIPYLRWLTLLFTGCAGYISRRWRHFQGPNTTSRPYRFGLGKLTDWALHLQGNQVMFFVCPC